VVIAKSADQRFFYGYIVTAAGFCIWLIGWGSYTPSFSVFYKPLLAEFGWTRAEAALAYALSFIVQAVLAIIMGWLTDKLGPRIVVTVFGSFLGLCYLLMSQINALWQFQLNYALVGSFGLSTLTVPVMATVARWFVKKRGLMTGIVQAGMGIGGLIFSPFAGWLIITYGWRHAYVVFGIIALTAIIIAGLFLKRDPHDIGQLPDGVLEEPPERKHHHPHSPAARFSLRGALSTSQFWMVAGLYCSFGFCRSTFTAHIAAHVQDVGFSLIDGANVLAILTGSSIIGRIGIGRLADMIGNRAAFMIGFAITTAILMWGLVADELWELYLFGAVFGFGWGAQAVLRFTITSEIFGVTSLGLVMGIFTFAASGAASFGSYFAGYIFDVVGNYQFAFGMGIALSIMGIILAWLLKPALRTPAMSKTNKS
jgi:MFS family permease